MRKALYIFAVCLCGALLVYYFGATTSKRLGSSEIYDANIFSTSNEMQQSQISLDVEEQGILNMVDERFELLSLVFRLAGREEYGDLITEY